MEIDVKLPDGNVIKGKAWETTPLSIANQLSYVCGMECLSFGFVCLRFFFFFNSNRKTLAKVIVVAKVNDQLWDLSRPLEESCSLRLLKFDDAEAKDVFWHSSAHILGGALERVFHGYLCTGPPIEGGGFFYDIRLKDGRTVNPQDVPVLQALVDETIKGKHGFEMLRIPRDRAVQMFQYSPFKSEILENKVPDSDSEGVGTLCTVYRCGDLIDLCRGPHLPDTGRAAAFQVWKFSSAYWKGDANNPVVQRVYGISFPEKKLLEEWRKQQEALEQKSHLVIGTKQQLFFVEPHYSPGSTFWLPHGARIYNRLIEFIRSEYKVFGFTEVITPNIYNNELWTTSGHFPKYEKDMFVLDVDKQKWALKPMNCPGHCVMFKHMKRSYRELPIRFADFGVLHRNEAAGALRGLTRVRRFQQDDAHIFCKEEDVLTEVGNQLKFMQKVYGIFNYKFSLELSTRPDNYLGEIEVWNNAEAQLEKALNAFGHPWKLNKGDGAFYGPKIDVHIQDSLGRSFQCATVQLDFQLPIRFQLEYQGKEQGPKDADGPVLRPVMIHRAIYGSLERFLGILMEHVEGKWPLWLSPRQFMVIPVSKHNNDYAEEVYARLVQLGYYAEVDVSGKTLDKKILEHSLFNYLLVVGGREQTNKSVNVRKRKETEDEKQEEKEMPFDEFIEQVKSQVSQFK